MPEPVKDYAADMVSIIVGIAPISGFAEGSKISITKPEDGWLLKVGVGGTVTRARKKHPIYLATLKLMQTSVSNDILMGLWHLDQETKGGGKVPFKLKDNWGTTAVFAPEAWIIKPPDVEIDEEPTPREWGFVLVSDKSIWIGGN